jgi:uncharacterized membrane protein
MDALESLPKMFEALVELIDERIGRRAAWIAAIVSIVLLIGALLVLTWFLTR